MRLARVLVSELPANWRTRVPAGRGEDDLLMVGAAPLLDVAVAIRGKLEAVRLRQTPR